MRSGAPAADGLFLLPVEELDELRELTRTAAEMFVRTMQTRTLPDAEALRPVASSAGRLAEEGLAIGDVLAACHRGCRSALRRSERGRASERPLDQSATMELLVAFLGELTRVVSDGHAAGQSGLRHGSNARQELLRAVLGGADVASVATRLGLTLPQRFLVLAITIGAFPSDDAADVNEGDEGAGNDGDSAARRTILQLRRQVQMAEPDALAVYAAGSATVLVPCPEEPAVAWMGRAQQLVRSLARSLPATLLVAAEFCAPAECAQAATLAGEVLEVARRFGRTDGLVTLDDVLVEYQLSRPSPARERLAAILDPLAHHPEKLETLRDFLTLGLSRQRLAARMHVHPNTIDYRLRSAATLIGLRPTEPAEAQKIMAALAARFQSLPAGESSGGPR